MKNLATRNWKILLVDDDEDDYVLLDLMISRVLKDHAELQWISDPDRAVETTCTNHFDAAILDSHLDHTSGIELIERICKGCPAVPLIFISDWPDPLIFDQALAKGASAAISKAQLNGETLVQVISEAVLKNPARFSDSLN